MLSCRSPGRKHGVFATFKINISGRRVLENFNMADLDIQAFDRLDESKRREALDLLLQDRSPEAEAALQATIAQQAMISLVSLRRSAVVGAAAGHLQPGRIGMIWPPRCVRG